LPLSTSRFSAIHFAKAAIENRDIGRAHDLEQPPRPRRGLQRAVVIEHDAAAIAEAQRLHPAGELLRLWHGVGQGAGGVGQLGEVEEHRAGDVLRLIFCRSVAAHFGQEIARIDDPQIAGAHILRQPVRAYQYVHVPPLLV
jgi:hypothetical protein